MSRHSVAKAVASRRRGTVRVVAESIGNADASLGAGLALRLSPGAESL